METYGDSITFATSSSDALGMIIASVVGMLIFLIPIIIFYMFCQFILAKKLNNENPWMAFVPILNLY